MNQAKPPATIAISGRRKVDPVTTPSAPASATRQRGLEQLERRVQRRVRAAWPLAHPEAAFDPRHDGDADRRHQRQTDRHRQARAGAPPGDRRDRSRPLRRAAAGRCRRRGGRCGRRRCRRRGSSSRTTAAARSRSSHPTSPGAPTSPPAHGARPADPDAGPHRVSAGLDRRQLADVGHADAIGGRPATPTRRAHDVTLASWVSRR